MRSSRVIFLPRGKEIRAVRRFSRWARFEFGLAGDFVSPRWSGRCVRNLDGRFMIVADSVYGVEEIPTILCSDYPSTHSV